MRDQLSQMMKGIHKSFMHSKNLETLAAGKKPED